MTLMSLMLLWKTHICDRARKTQLYYTSFFCFVVKLLFLYIFRENPLKVTIFQTRATKREIVECNFVHVHGYDITFFLGNI